MTSTLYGPNTELAVSASLPSSPPVSDEPELVRAYAEVKAACARANVRADVLDADIGAAIDAAAREVIAGQHADQFPSRIGASAGTWGVNMNLNEVLATRAMQLLDGAEIHPNDHVNRSQSTNETYPTALMLAVLRIAPDAVRALDGLADALDEKAGEYEGWRRLGRTCLRDAVSAPIDGTHRAQARGIRRVRDGLEQAVRALTVLPLGATAIGTGIGAPDGFAELAVRELADITGLELTAAPDLLDAMAHADRWAAVASAGRRAAALLSKLATDVRLLSSGPQGGLGEITLVETKPGSSIMPGKKNPSVAQMTMRLAVRVRGAAATVDGAVESAELEINEMLPVIFEALLQILRDVTDSATAMAERLVPLIVWDADVAAAKVAVALDSYVEMAARTGYEQASSSATAAR